MDKSFQKGIMFGLGFALIIALFVSVGIAYSNSKVSDNHDHTSHMEGITGHCSVNLDGKQTGSCSMMNMAEMPCMDGCDDLSSEECIKEMDEDKDGKCDICGMSVQHCIDSIYEVV